MKLTATAVVSSLALCAVRLPARAPRPATSAASADLVSELHSAAAGEASLLDSLAVDFPEISTIQSEVDNSMINTASIASQFEDLATDSSFQAVVQANPTLVSLFSEFDAVFATTAAPATATAAATARAKAKARRARA